MNTVLKKLIQTEPTAWNQDFWFPGKYVGGISAIVSPIFLLTGVLLRLKFHYFFPQQLVGFQDSPRLMVTSYNFFLIGNIFLWPAIITLAREIGKKKPLLALWGGSFVIFGLFARTFHGGVDHLAFQLVSIQGLDSATKFISDSYGAFNLIATLNGAILAGWIILALGAYLSGTLGVLQSVALSLMSGLMLGVLKGSSWMSVVAITGLGVALVPLGVRILKTGPGPTAKNVIIWSTVTIVVVAILYFLGLQG